MQKTPSALAPYRTTTYDDFCVSRCSMLTEFEDLSKTTSQVLIFSGLARGAIAIPVQRFISCDELLRALFWGCAENRNTSTTVYKL